ncbi:hypothetical protein BT63DRAFT_203829 [Microthyrium microscopicum]|uniref:F-box domain-containing protein n=1 Tax=Microthyrium microscopicum TaxID=703497 RepID=A0A6A6UGV2_9PEZI|nr:hypothetical protein BT63DRAFT_203829 [Microthyrium microscopicum]
MAMAQAQSTWDFTEMWMALHAIQQDIHRQLYYWPHKLESPRSVKETDCIGSELDPNHPDDENDLTSVVEFTNTSLIVDDILNEQKISNGHTKVKRDSMFSDVEDVLQASDISLGFVDLPDEVLLRVMMLLPKSSLLSMRATDTKLNKLAMAQFLKRFVPTERSITRIHHSSLQPPSSYDEDSPAINPMMTKSSLQKWTAIVDNPHIGANIQYMQLWLVGGQRDNEPHRENMWRHAAGQSRDKDNSEDIKRLLENLLQKLPNLKRLQVKEADFCSETEVHSIDLGSNPSWYTALQRRLIWCVLSKVPTSLEQLDLFSLLSHPSDFPALKPYCPTDSFKPTLTTLRSLRLKINPGTVVEEDARRTFLVLNEMTNLTDLELAGPPLPVAQWKPGSFPKPEYYDGFWSRLLSSLDLPKLKEVKLEYLRCFDPHSLIKFLELHNPCKVTAHGILLKHPSHTTRAWNRNAPAKSWSEYLQQFGARTITISSLARSFDSRMECDDADMKVELAIHRADGVQKAILYGDGFESWNAVRWVLGLNPEMGKRVC